MDRTNVTGSDAGSNGSGKHKTTLGFVGGLAMGIILSGLIFVLFSMDIHKRMSDLEKSSTPPVSEKFAELQKTVNALHEAGAQKHPDPKAVDDTAVQALGQKTGELALAIAALKNESDRTAAALDAKISQYRAEAAALAQERESQLSQNRTAAVETLRWEFYTAMEKLEKDFRALVGPTSPPADPSKTLQPAMENLRREYQAKLEELVKQAALSQKLWQDRQEKIEMKIEELCQGAAENAALPGKLEEIRHTLAELGRTRDVVAAQQKICDKLRSDIDAIDGRVKLVEQKPQTQAQVTANSVQFEHLSEQLKTLLARTMIAGSTNIRFDFGRISLIAEAATRDFTQELVFPEPFAGDPIVLGFCPDNPRWDIYIQSVTPESCEINVKSGARIPSGEYILAWVAIGKRGKF